MWFQVGIFFFWAGLASAVMLNEERSQTSTFQIGNTLIGLGPASDGFPLISYLPLGCNCSSSAAQQRENQQRLFQHQQEQQQKEAQQQEAQQRRWDPCPVERVHPNGVALFELHMVAKDKPGTLILLNNTSPREGPALASFDPKRGELTLSFRGLYNGCVDFNLTLSSPSFPFPVPCGTVNWAYSGASTCGEGYVSPRATVITAFSSLYINASDSPGRDEIWAPIGFGVKQPATVAGRDLYYPSGGNYGATMQYLTYSRGRQGTLIATLCGEGSNKIYSYGGGIVPGSGMILVEVPTPNGGLASTVSWNSSFPIISSPYSGSSWTASQVYRLFVMNHSTWVTEPLSKRPHSSVLSSPNIWLNSGWSETDIFNISQGDPSVVLSRLRSLQILAPKLPNMTAFHWYVWDNITFDADYPDYFPEKPGFSHAVKEIVAMGYKIFPYINGRLWDTGTKSWITEKAIKSAAKNAAYAINNTPQAIYVEQYGSGANLTVMCPFTDQWNEKISLTVREIMKSGVQGVYVDQIAAAYPAPCYDTSHNHSVGGGDYWSKGYRNILKNSQKIEKLEKLEKNTQEFEKSENTQEFEMSENIKERKKISQIGKFNKENNDGEKYDQENGLGKSQNQIDDNIIHRHKIDISDKDEVVPRASILTESNAEVYMGEVEGYLSLFAFADVDSPMERESTFQSVYGGYFNAMGCMFFQSDITLDDMAGFRRKLSMMFVEGAQLGWFSLGGTPDPPQMALFDLLTTYKNGSALSLSVSLSLSREIVREYFVHGIMLEKIVIHSNETERERERDQTEKERVLGERERDGRETALANVTTGLWANEMRQSSETVRVLFIIMNHNPNPITIPSRTNLFLEQIFDGIPDYKERERERAYKVMEIDPESGVRRLIDKTKDVFDLSGIVVQSMIPLLLEFSLIN